MLAVPPSKWDEFSTLCAAAKASRRRSSASFVPTGRLAAELSTASRSADLAMEFLHDGRPPVVREAVYRRRRPRAAATAATRTARLHRRRCCKILGSLNVASKEWIIRQYDHEVQGGSVIKPLVGVANDGPSDAAVMRPVLGSRRGHGDRLRHESALRRLRPVSHGRQRDRRGGAQLRGRRGRSARGSRFSTISAGATPSGRRRWARWCGRRWPATTWRSRSARRSSAARTA